MINKLTTFELKQRKYYDEIAKIYDKYHFNKNALQYRAILYDKLFKNIDLKKTKVLDAMCGGGEATYYFINKKALVAGLDISKENCKIYKSRFKKNKIVCSSIAKTPFPNSYFDIVVTDSLHHLYPNLQEGIKEIYRILKPEGYFVFWEPCTGSIFNILRKIWYRIDKTYFQSNEKAINYEEIKRNNFNFIEIKKIYGGGVAYLFINNALIFRFNTNLIRFYSSILIEIERIINLLNSRLLSCWVLSLWKKK